jgi:DNA-binding response OmpR family regulator
MIKLFIAEDDPLMGRMYERAFKVAGYDLTVAFDGEDALTKLSAMDSVPAVAVIDVMMPKKSGFDVLRAMKADVKLKNVPVILLTNLAGDQDAEKGLSLGAVLYLVKSQYTPKQIVDKVEEIVKSSTRGEGIPEVKVNVKP